MQGWACGGLGVHHDKISVEAWKLVYNSRFNRSELANGAEFVAIKLRELSTVRSIFLLVVGNLIRCVCDGVFPFLVYFSVTTSFSLHYHINEIQKRFESFFFAINKTRRKMQV